MTTKLGSSPCQSYRRWHVRSRLDPSAPNAGFTLTDVLLRDADQVIIAALKS